MLNAIKPSITPRAIHVNKVNAQTTNQAQNNRQDVNFKAAGNQIARVGFTALALASAVWFMFELYTCMAHMSHTGSPVNGLFGE